MSRSAELLKAYEALGYNDFKTQFKRLIKVLNEHDFEYCLTGGLAYNEYAPQPRATQDLGLLIISDESEVMEALEEFDFRPVPDEGCQRLRQKRALRFAVQYLL